MSSSRRGFTLSQLLVLLALLALLAAFLLPAIAKVRLAAEQTTSQGHLKQLAVAIHNYHDVFNKMSPGVDDNHFSALAYHLPYIEQDNLFKLIDFKQPCDAPANKQVRDTIVRGFLNPVDKVPALSPAGAGTSYLFNAGTKPGLKQNNGPFHLNSQARLQVDFTDGTSNTILMTETLRGDGLDRAVDARRQHIAYKEDALKELKEDAGVADFKQSKYVAGNRGAAWIDGRFLQGTFNAGRQPNDERPDVTCGGMGGWSGPRSITNEINVGYADGTVRRMDAKRISKVLWQRSLDPNDGQPLVDD